MPKVELQKKKTIVMSIGGSLIVPNGGPDADFLTRLRKFILANIKKGHSFVLVCGGGKTARHYIDAGAMVKKKIVTEDLDWLGIHATRLNAHLVRTIFREIAHPVVIKNPTRISSQWNGKLMIAAGWKPGWSTDYVACRIAKRLGATHVINASNIDQVYSEDPRKNPKAKPFDDLAWTEYRKMVGDKWDPGLSAPFDPIASKFCHKNKISVSIVNGDDFKNIGKLVSGKSFRGTVLS